MDMEALMITVGMIVVLYGAAYLIFKYVESIEND
jgi:hypothetical protein